MKLHGRLNDDNEDPLTIDEIRVVKVILITVPIDYSGILMYSMHGVYNASHYEQCAQICET